MLRRVALSWWHSLQCSLLPRRYSKLANTHSFPVVRHVRSKGWQYYVLPLRICISNCECALEFACCKVSFFQAQALLINRFLQISCHSVTLCSYKLFWFLSFKHLAECYSYSAPNPLLPIVNVGRIRHCQLTVHE